MHTSEQPQPRYPVYKKSSGLVIGMADLVNPHPLTKEQEQLRDVLRMREGPEKMTFEAIGKAMGMSHTQAFYMYQKAKGRL